MLLIQGEDDPTDPLGQSQEMYRALRQVGAIQRRDRRQRRPHPGPHPLSVVDSAAAWWANGAITART